MKYRAEIDGLRVTISLLFFIFFISLGLAHWGAYNKPSPTFFLLPTRGWELLMGVFVASRLYYRGNTHSTTSNQILSLLGLIMVVSAMFIYDRHTPFPSLFGLIPTFGTLLIIYSAVSGTYVAALLSCHSLVADII